MTAIVRAAKDSGKYLANRYRLNHCKFKLTVLTLRKVIQVFGSTSKFLGS